jgi:hypothetical protein
MPMTAMETVSLTEAAEILGVDFRVVSGLVKALKIEPKPVKRNGKAKGLDVADMARLRRALGQPD